MRIPAPYFLWAATQLGANPIGGSLGAQGDMSSAMMLDRREVYVHCRRNDLGNDYTNDCFAPWVGSSGEVVVDSLAPLPELPVWYCHGSDGGWFAMAGGWDENDNDQ